MITAGNCNRFSLVGDRRVQFAWLPVRRYTAPAPFTQPAGWLRMQENAQTCTSFEGWIAFANDNQGAVVYSDRAIATAYALGLLSVFLAAAAAITPLIPSLPLVR